MKELIANLEAATEPSRELDLDILWEIFPEERKKVFDGVRHISTMTAVHGEFWYLPLADREFDCPRYIGEVDTALTLVPKGYSWMAGCAPGTRFFATLYTTEESGLPHDGIEATGATAAIAICIAALKARSAA
jgi:hypothetical protein